MWIIQETFLAQGRELRLIAAEIMARSRHLQENELREYFNVWKTEF